MVKRGFKYIYVYVCALLYVSMYGVHKIAKLKYNPQPPKKKKKKFQIL